MEINFPTNSSQLAVGELVLVNHSLIETYEMEKRRLMPSERSFHHRRSGHNHPFRMRYFEFRLLRLISLTEALQSSHE